MIKTNMPALPVTTVCVSAPVCVWECVGVGVGASVLTSAPSSARIGRQDAAAAKGCAAVQRAFVVAALSSFPCPHTPPPPCVAPPLIRPLLQQQQQQQIERKSIS